MAKPHQAEMPLARNKQEQYSRADCSEVSSGTEDRWRQALLVALEGI